MGIALTLLQYLDDRHIDYDTLVHGFSETAMKNAEAAHIPGERLVKAVILKDDTGYLMAVLPATRHIDFPTLKQALDRDVEMVEEDDLTTMFDDCDIGAIPPVPGEPEAGFPVRDFHAGMLIEELVRLQGPAELHPVREDQLDVF